MVAAPTRRRAMEHIDSPHNPLVKLAAKLLRSQRHRYSEGRILLDGAHLVSAYRERFGLQEASILVSKTGLHLEEIRSLIDQPVARVAELPDRLLEKIAPVAAPSGLIAIVPIPRLKPDPSAEPFWILLEGIQDPGNLGAILRSAAAIGATRAVLSASCADPWSPKCLRGGMGAQFVLAVSDHADLLPEMARFSGKILAAAPRTGRTVFEADLSGPLAVVVGGEGGGLSPQVQAATQGVIQIPLSAPIESLNVAAAVAIVCYERLRQKTASVSPRRA